MSDELTRENLKEVLGEELAESMFEEFPKINQLYHFILEKLEKENYWQISFKDGSRFLFIAPNGKLELEEENAKLRTENNHLNERVDLWRERYNELKELINELQEFID